MCGIALQIGDSQLSSSVTSAVESLLKQRGPDDTLRLSQRGFDAVFTRLKFEGGGETASLVLAEGIVVLLNGEIWNYREVAAAHGVSATSEYEAIRGLYRILGPTFARAFNGMFAICVVDTQMERIVLARDPLGAKPLYMLPLGQTFLIASTLQVLLTMAGGGASTALNEEFLANFSVFGASTSEELALPKVTQVPNGCFVDIRMRDKKSVIASYESVFMAVSREHPDSTLALGARENTQSLRATVKRSLGHRSKQPVGLLLSGGVDSTLLAALMLEHLRPMDVYALFWGATTSPDYEWARLAATRLCLDLYCVDSPPIRQQPMDALATSGVPAFQIAEGFRATRAIFPELRLVYCGEGADELYGGYDWTLDPLSRARLLLKRMANAATTTDLIEKTRTVLNRVTSAASLSEVEEVLYALDRGFILTDQHLLPFDVAAGMFGFEVRMPFLDLDHFRFATSLPRRARYDGGRRKPVLKALLSQLIPGLPLEFFERPKVTLPDSLNTLFPSAQVLRPLDIAASEVLSARFGVSAPVAAWLQCLVEESGHFNPAGRPG